MNMDKFIGIALGVIVLMLFISFFCVLSVFAPEDKDLSNVNQISNTTVSTSIIDEKVSPNNNNNNNNNEANFDNTKKIYYSAYKNLYNKKIVSYYGSTNEKSNIVVCKLDLDNLIGYVSVDIPNTQYSTDYFYVYKNGVYHQMEKPHKQNGAYSGRSQTMDVSSAKDHLIISFAAFAFKEQDIYNNQYVMENDNFLLDGHYCYEIKCMSDNLILNTVYIDKNNNLIMQAGQQFYDGSYINYRFKYNSDSIKIPDDVLNSINR